MSITQTFDLNLIPEQSPVVIHCDQYDKGTGRLVVKLYEGDVAYTPSGTAVIQGTKPDGKGFNYSATLSGNTVTANLTEQMTAVAGKVRCQIVVTETTGRTGTFVFILEVQRSALPSNTDMSESDYQIIEQAIEDAQDAAEDAEAWAVGERGGVPVSSGDETYHNNSKYWCDQASQYAQGIVFKGSVAFANIPTTGQSSGDMYNITDDFTTDSRFIEGSGIKCEAGTNIVWIASSSKWDILATTKIGDLGDLNDVTITTVKNGMLLAYNGSTSKWVNIWPDILLYNPASLEAFVNATADWDEGHNFAKFFKVNDSNDVLGLGGGWFEGFVSYQNNKTTPNGHIGGNGIAFSVADGTAYKMFIDGGSPYTIKTVKIDYVTWSANNILGAKNLFKNTLTTTTDTGVTYTVNSDKSVSISMTNRPSSNTGKVLGWIDVKKDVTYTLSGGLDEDDRIDLRLSNYNTWTNNTAGKEVISPATGSSITTFTPNADATLMVYLKIASTGSTGSVGTVYPMIRLADDPDTTYVPFAMTNRELTDAMPEDLNDLSDVTLTSPSSGQILKFDGSKWVNGNGGGGGASALSDLTDVSISSEQNNQVLTYDSNSGKWVNANPTGGMQTNGSNAASNVGMTGTKVFTVGSRHLKSAAGEYAIELGDGGNATGYGAYAEGSKYYSLNPFSQTLAANTSSETLATTRSLTTYPYQSYSLTGYTSTVSNIEVFVDGGLDADKIITNGNVTVRVTQDGNDIKAYYTNTDNVSHTLYYGCSTRQNTASGDYSHAEGVSNTASGTRSHVEGYNNTASGIDTHAEGQHTTATGSGTHTEGYSTTASGNNSHAEGIGTYASGNYQHVSGKYNILDNSSTYAVIVGNGTASNARSNALTLDWSGNLEAAGDVKNGNGVSLDGMNKVSTLAVDLTSWSTDTTSQSGSTLYKKQISLNHLYVDCPSVEVGAGTGYTLPTTAEQTSYDLIQYVTVDDTVPCLYLYASAVPTTAFYITVTGVD